TLAVVATRDLREFDLGRYYDNDVMNYIPSGEGELFVRDITTTATCNRCHDPLGEHGGRYQDVQVCQQCHNPGLVNDENGLSYTLSAVTHRVHSSNEPETGEIHYPVLPDDQWWDCEVCHTGGTPTADYPIVTNPNPAPTCDGRGGGMTTVSWMADDPALVRIGSAEGKIFASSGGSGSQETGNWVTDGMSFVLVDTDTGTMMDSTEAMLSVFGCAGNAPGAFAGEAGAVHTHWLTRPSRVACAGCHVDVDFEGGTNHPAQSDDDGCGLCHAPTGDEFDLSVQGAHTIPYKSTALAGVLVTIKEVRGGMAGQSPTVVFSLTDRDGRLDPAALNRLRFSLSGPNADFDFYEQEDALGKMVPFGNDWAFTFATRVPGNATGSWTIGVEGRISGVELTEDLSINDQMQNVTMPFSVDGSAVAARRDIVDDSTCEGCHSNLSLHGENRHDADAYCQTCHMPGATDEAVRLEGNDESIHFKYMVHKIHMGAELENGYVVYGYRSSIHDYSDVHYPGDLRNCEGCHNEGTYNLPIAEGALPTFSPNTVINPMLPETAACLSCHDSDVAAIHADSNTGSLGEACSVCHGEGKTYSVERVHAR
ncbi:MAG: OmcA/MtrC family decaheme c-type cytochrome, partial [Gammaproteobacteria bacterium]|nr:OmcA/MtrC family decaheme c-type cytochrome [Gammaproteobacteria bacterium]